MIILSMQGKIVFDGSYADFLESGYSRPYGSDGAYVPTKRSSIIRVLVIIIAVIVCQFCMRKLA